MFSNRLNPKLLWLGVVAFAVGVLLLLFLGHLNSGTPDDMPELALKVAAGDTNALAQLEALGPDAIPALGHLCTYRDGWRRLAWRVAPLLPRKAAGMFVARVGPLQDERVRAAAAKNLGAFGPKSQPAVPFLVQALHDSQGYVAMEAAAALAKIGSGALPALTQALNEQNAAVRHAAAYALGEMGPSAEQAVPALVARLADPDAEVRSSSAASLLSIGYPSVLAISNVVDHADASARQAAAAELLRLYRSLRSMVPALVKMSQADEPEVRRTAIATLGAMRVADEASFNALRKACHDSSVQVQMAALAAIETASARASSAVPEVASCLGSSTPEVRKSAARVLGVIGPAAYSALTTLKEHSETDDQQIRVAAREAIDRITHAVEDARQSAR